MGNDKFIFTTDKDTADKLLAIGFTQIPAGTLGYKFINSMNNRPLSFSIEGIDKSKIKFTNIYTL